MTNVRVYVSLLKDGGGVRTGEGGEADGLEDRKSQTEIERKCQTFQSVAKENHRIEEDGEGEEGVR